MIARKGDGHTFDLSIMNPVADLVGALRAAPSARRALEKAKVANMKGLLSCAITSDASPHTGTSATPTVQVRETDPGRRWRGYIDGAPALPWLAFVLL